MKARLARLEVVDEGDDYLVLDKPAGLVCHPTVGDEYSSLIGRIRLYLEGQSGLAPHFVNRLDRETSGLVLVSTRKESHRSFCQAYEQAKKTYWAVVQGWPEPDQGLIDQALGQAVGSLVKIKQAVVVEGKSSQTAWKVLQRRQRKGERVALLEVQPLTGRMHQIRVHLAHLGHPVVGDKIYGADESFFVEALEQGWTERLERGLATRRHLLSAVAMKVGSHAWKVDPPQDMVDFMGRGVV